MLPPAFFYERSELCNPTFGKLLASAVLVFSGWQSSLIADETVDLVDFNRDIRPIFTANCTACHGGVKQAGDLSFVYADSVEGVIDAGSAESSYLVERIEDEDDESRMPPAEHGPRLSEEQVGLIRKWIDQGAKWEKHWAYRLPEPHAAPEVSQADWTSAVSRLRKRNDRNVGCVVFLST